MHEKFNSNKQTNLSFMHLLTTWSSFCEYFGCGATIIYKKNLKKNNNNNKLIKIIKLFLNQILQITDGNSLFESNNSS